MKRDISSSGSISKVHALEILDSRGNPTLEVFVTTQDGSVGKAAVPSGASTGEREAVELRDGDPNRYLGKGVLRAIEHVNGPLAAVVLGKDVGNQRLLDQLLIQADGSENKGHFGANALLGVSLAIARARAAIQKQPLYRSLGIKRPPVLPCPMMNILNGGVHADNGLDFQEFMIRPVGASSFQEGVRWGVEIFHRLKGLLKEKGHIVAVGDEGGFAPRLASHEEALEMILKAIEKSGYRPREQITLALDCAASEFYHRSSKRYTHRSCEEQIDYLLKLCATYPIDSIEDPLDQNDWEGWEELTRRLPKGIQLVGDDLFVTNPIFLKKGIEKGIANAILIKLNQIGTLTETLDTIEIARAAGYGFIISHRSGETVDTFITDLAVATGGQIKTGAPSRGERVAKYNRGFEIAEEGIPFREL